MATRWPHPVIMFLSWAGVSPTANAATNTTPQLTIGEDPMLEGRKYAASVCHTGVLYCSGGQSGDSFLSSLEVLDPWGSWQWASLPPMKVERCNHCLASWGRFLWAIGGEDNYYFSDVQRFDVEQQQWSRVKSLNTPRCFLSASVIGGRIHVIGGETTIYTRVRTEEVYDENEDRWATAAPLNKERDCHGSCLVRSLPDVDADKF